MRTSAQNTLTAAVFTLALAMLAGSVQAADISATTGYQQARTDTRSDLLVGSRGDRDDDRILPRHVLEDERGEIIYP